MTDSLKTLIRYMLDAHNAYNGTGMMIALFFVAFMIIVFYCKDEKLKKSVTLPLILLIGVMYVIVPLFDTFKYYLIYYDGRMFWMLITPVIIAAGFTVFVVNIKERRNRIIALIVLFFVFLYCGEFKISGAMYQRADNPYKLPKSAVDITDYVLSQKDSPKMIVPYTIAHPFRQISTDVYLLYGEDATSGRITGTSGEFREMCQEMENVTPNLNIIVPEALENNVDYILFDTVYTEFCENGNINIYNYPVDEDYVYDRQSTVTFDQLKNIKVIDDGENIYWDLSEYGLKYCRTFGQYILYEF